LGEGLGGWLIDLIACGAGYCELRIDVRGRAHFGGEDDDYQGRFAIRTSRVLAFAFPVSWSSEA
jgi:hypothetical protein